MKRYKPAIGEPFLTESAPDVIAASDVRRFAEAYELASDLYFDPETAQSYGYRDVLVPPTMLLPMVIPPYWHPGGPSMEENAIPGFAWTLVDLPGDEMIATALDFDVLKSVTVGTRLSAVYMIESITPKRTRLGEGNFVQFRVGVTDDTGDEVATLRLTAYRYTPTAASQGRDSDHA